VVEEGIHVLELVGGFGRRLSYPVFLEPLFSVVLVFLCFYQLAENAPYIFVEVFCQFLSLHPPNILRHQGRSVPL